MSFSNAIQNLIFGSTGSTRRRQQIRSQVSSPEALECRMLLTNAAPTLGDLVAENGTIEAVVQDDQSYGQIEITVDFDGDGIEDFVLDTSEGESISIDVSNYIPANETAPVTVVITETYSNEEAGTTDILTNSVTVQASGVTILAMNFDWIDAASSAAHGIIADAEDAVADLSVMYREVGATDWLTGNNADSEGLFDFHIPDADGEKDFEFVVVHGGVFGDVVTINDVTAYDDGAGGESSGSPGSGGSGTGEGWGSEGDDDDDDDGNFPGVIF